MNASTTPKPGTLLLDRLPFAGRQGKRVQPRAELMMEARRQHHAQSRDREFDGGAEKQ